MVTETKETPEVSSVERASPVNANNVANTLNTSETPQENVAHEKCVVMDVKGVGLAETTTDIKVSDDLPEAVVTENVQNVMETSPGIIESVTSQTILDDTKVNEEKPEGVNCEKVNLEETGTAIANILNKPEPEIVSEKIASIISAVAQTETKVLEEKSVCEIITEAGTDAVVSEEMPESEVTLKQTIITPAPASEDPNEIKVSEEGQTVTQPIQIDTMASENNPAPAPKVVNTSLGLLSQYVGSSSDEEDDEEMDEAQEEANATKQLFEKIFQQNTYRTVSSGDDEYVQFIHIILGYVFF